MLELRLMASCIGTVRAVDLLEGSMPGAAWQVGLRSADRRVRHERALGGAAVSQMLAQIV